MDSGMVKLEILDLADKVVRTFDNQKDKTFKRYEGGPSPKKVLPTKKGVNRFAWDFRRNSIPGVANVFVNGGYGGSSVAPGPYKIRLTVNEETQTKEVILLKDPRLVEVSQKDFTEQQALLTQIDDNLLDIHRSVNNMRKVKKQIKSLQSSLKGQEGVDTLVTVGKNLIKSIGEWENKLIQPNQKTFQDVINFPNQLNAHFMNLKGKIDSHDPRPTAGVKLRLKELNDEWASNKAVLEGIISKEVKGYNDLYHKLKLPALVIPK